MMPTPRSRTRGRVAAIDVLIAIAVLIAAPLGAAAQLTFKTGQPVIPVYEGWETNADGSFNVVFGYFNRNMEEELDVPVGPDNTITPGPADQGQPTHFLPRRNQFIFKVRVPKDFGNKEVVWTVVS